LGSEVKDRLVILGVDPGIASMGVCLLACFGDRIVAKRVIVVRTELDRRFKAAVDEDRRMRKIAEALLAAHTRGYTIDIVAYEYYRPFQQSGGKHTAARGRLVAKAEGVVVGYANAIGALTVPVDPRDPKRELGARCKAAVSQVLEAKIEGLTELLDAAGRTGYHGSDAAGCAYVAMIKAFKAARGTT